MSDELIREVNEDLKRERYQKLWKTYGRFIVAIAVAIVVIVAAVVGWRDYQLKQGRQQGNRFAAAVALAAQSSPADAVGAFASLAADAGAGYRTLARFQAAAAKMRENDRQGAIDYYDEIRGDGGADPLLQQLAAVMAAMQTLENGDPDGALERLEDLTGDGAAFSYTARELEALAYLQLGDTAQAKSQLTALSDDLSAPAGIRARATELLAALAARR